MWMKRNTIENAAYIASTINTLHSFTWVLLTPHTNAPSFIIKTIAKHLIKRRHLPGIRVFTFVNS